MTRPTPAPGTVEWEKILGWGSPLPRCAHCGRYIRGMKYWRNRATSEAMHPACLDQHYGSEPDTDPGPDGAA